MKPATDHLKFLDYFCVLFALLYLNTMAFGPSRWPTAVWVTATVVFVTSWFVWRLRSNPPFSWAIAAASVGVLMVSNTPISVISVWLGLVALAVAAGLPQARMFAVMVVVATTGIHLVSGSSWTKLLVEVVAMVMVALAGLALARSVVTAIETEDQLRKANVKLKHSLANSRELALSQERERVAAGLHDGLGHRLTTIGLSLDYATRMLERDPAKARAELVQARAATTDALNAMRSTVRAMKPVALIDDSLDATFTQLASSFDGTDLSVEIKGSGASSISEESATMILLFVQEALTNVVRHAQASHARITLGDMRVTVDDNGRGYDGEPDFGLTSLRERARELGGDVTWQPHGGIDDGFRLELILPEATHG